MARICPDCNGRGKAGRKPCATCNPSGALGDIAVSLGRGLRNTVTGRTAETDGQTTTRRPHRLATETTTRANPPKPKTTTRRPAARKPATTTATPMPACEKCGTRGALKVTRKGMTCVGGC